MHGRSILKDLFGGCFVLKWEKLEKVQMFRYQGLDLPRFRFTKEKNPNAKRRKFEIGWVRCWLYAFEKLHSSRGTQLMFNDDVDNEYFVTRAGHSLPGPRTATLTRSDFKHFHLIFCTYFNFYHQYKTCLFRKPFICYTWSWSSSWPQ